MIRNSLWAALIGLGAAFIVVWAVSLRSDQYFSDLASWRDTARQVPEGTTVGDIFNDAVAAGAIRWNTQLGQIELRRDVPLQAALEDKLFGMREAGAVIQAALAQTRYVGGYVAIRGHMPDCESPCEADVKWDFASQVAALPSLAVAVSSTRTAAVPAPLPRLFFLLSRTAGPGFLPWQGYATGAPLRLQTPAGAFDEIDVIGRLEGDVPAGWQVVGAWCLERGQEMVPCSSLDEPEILRLRRSAVASVDGTLVLGLKPVRLVPKTGARGRFFLTDRIVLGCDDGGMCVPEWRPNDRRIRYARPAGDNLGGTDISGQSAAVDVFGEWVQIGPRGLVTSDLARSNGITSVLGDGAPRAGSVLAAVDDLPRATQTRFSIDGDIQKIVHEVLAQAAGTVVDSSFKAVGHRFPASGPQMSVVVLDLRQEQTMGAIVAAAGMPERNEGLSNWDAQAISFDRSAPLPPGSAAWTGSNWRHTPGSTWKLVTSLALIDAITSGTLAPRDAVSLQRAILGITAAEADSALGPDALSGAFGICPPVKRVQPVKGASQKAGCGQGFHGRIMDSGKPGPLHKGNLERYGLDQRTAKYGLEEAVAKSSNIWFIAMQLSVERMYAEHTAKDDLLLLRTLERLGLTREQPLDSGLGLIFQSREAANIDALVDQSDMQALAMGAFGQRLWAGPLITAQISGSIALNRNLQPALFVPMVAPELLFASGQGQTMLGEVRRGMRSVVSNADVGPGFGRGTAVYVFGTRAPGIVSRVAGKTGTAQRDEGLDRISTFTGWMDDTTGAPMFAIGCSATVLGQPTDGGGVNVPQLCPHISAEVLRRIAESEGAE